MARAAQAERRRRPVFVSPQLATLADAVPEGGDWLHEVKYDGYRLIATIDRGMVCLYTRSGLDWTHRFEGIARGVSSIKATSAVIDGEAVAFEPNGRSSFQQLQQRLEQGNGGPLSFVAFDLLHLDGRDVRHLPLTERRALLRGLLGRRAANGQPRLSDELPGDGQSLLTAACRLELEGVICKRRDAPYRSGRSRVWLKVKCGKRQEFVVVGYTPPQGSRIAIGALLLGVGEPGGLRYAGRVGTGMPHAMLVSLLRRLKPLHRAASPFGDHPTGLPAGVRWVEPRLVVEVAFTEWTTEGRLRHPSLIAVRDDKPARDVVREAENPARPELEGAMSTLAGVTISNPTRVVYPEPGLTKRDVAAFINKVAPLMLPHVAGRPLTFVRCPEGITDECFFQKHWTGTLPSTLDTVMVTQSDETRPYVVVHDAAGLVTLVQWGILEVHLWGARADSLERPDRITFDLDPGEGVTWADMRTGATAVRTVLEAVGLTSWLKTTGGKGLHVVVPIERRSAWVDVSTFARAVAERLSGEAPSRFVSVAAKAQRPGRIFIDWMRNTRGATSVAPWSARARPGAGVSVPVAWSQLGRVTAGDHWTIPSIMKGRLPADAWREMDGARQRLTKQMIAAMTTSR